MQQTNISVDHWFGFSFFSLYLKFDLYIERFVQRKLKVNNEYYFQKSTC